MSVARLAKTGASLMSGQGILILTQLLLPPLFLKRYGIAAYGEWLTLSAAANYLGTLNFGLHNFANNHVAIAYNRGDMKEVNVIQATAFAIVLGIVSLVGLIAAAMLLMPIATWLHLTTFSNAAAAATVYFLGLQVLVRMIFGFLQNAFLVVGALHRGNNWLNGLSTCILLMTVVLVLAQAPLVWIAVGSAALSVVFSILVGLDLYLNARVAFPKLQYTDTRRVMDILKPSGYFGMLFSTAFLVYQVPVVILQRLLGPADVVIFSVTRTVYSMSRQALTSVSIALGPEITELFGKGLWDRLMRLYDVSERAVFALVPLVTFGTFLATPLLMAIWMRKPQLFHMDVCIYMALISAVLGIKEHKYQFQVSINRHAEMARFLFFSYLAMVGFTIPAVKWYGVDGFLALWLATEVIQVCYVVWLNKLLFKGIASIDLQSLYRIVAMLVIGTWACRWIALATAARPQFIQVAAIAVFLPLLLVIEYPVFGLSALQQILKTRLSARLSARREAQMTSAI